MKLQDNALLFCFKSSVCFLKLNTNNLLHLPRYLPFLYCCCSVPKSGPTLCDPVGHSLPGSFVYGNFPGNNTGVCCHFFLQQIFLTQGLILHLLYWEVNSLPLSYLGSPLIFFTPSQRYTFSYIIALQTKEILLASYLEVLLAMNSLRFVRYQFLSLTNIFVTYHKKSMCIS